MSKPRVKSDEWDQIFAELILESEPPVEYIKNATVITKNGYKLIISPADFAELVARERGIDPELRDIQSWEVTINSSKIKRDVNKWVQKFISDIEASVTEEIGKSKSKKARKTKSRKN